MEENLIVKLTYEFALKIIQYSEKLEDKKKNLMANQLFKSVTSIGANVHEAQSAESKSDFVHKMKIADKETYETMYWLSLCKATESYPKPENLIEEIEVIKKIIGKIISSSKNKN